MDEKATDAVDDITTSLLCSGLHDCSSAGVHDVGEVSKHTGYRSWEQHIEHKVHLDTDVAEAHAIVPVIKVVVRPDDGVQGQIEVGPDSCGGQGSHGEVSMLPVLVDRWDIDQSHDDAKNRQSDGLRIGRVDVVVLAHIHGSDRSVHDAQQLLADSVDQNVGDVDGWC